MLPLPSDEASIMVLTDMSLSLFSVVLNLMVLNALREKDSLLSKTHNLVLANVCCSNLVSAVLVKSISIVHHGYSVIARVTQSNIAFCMVYTLGHRATWATLPWSISLLSWLRILHRLQNLKVSTKIGIRMNSFDTLSSLCLLLLCHHAIFFCKCLLLKPCIGEA